MVLNLFYKIYKVGNVCGSCWSSTQILKNAKNTNFRRTYYCHKNGLRVAEEHLENIRQHEDDVSKFKMAHAVAREILSDKDICLNSAIVSERNKDVMDYNIVGGRCKRLSLFFNSHSNIIQDSELSDEHILKVSIMGYVNEMLLSSYIIIDDILDGSEKRRNKPTWFKKVGRIASNDITLIESGIYLVMRHFFENEPYYIPCLKVLQDVKWIISCSMSLDYLTFDILRTNRSNCNWEVYNQLAFGIMGVSGFYMPIAIAMQMAGFKYDAELLLKMTAAFGYYAALENDFVDRYPYTTGKLPDEDIKLGKLTWLLLTALEHGDQRQKFIIEECYGKDDAESVQAVVNVYEELGMKGKCLSHKKDISNSISKEISTISDIKTRKCLSDALYMIDNWYKDA